MYMFIGAYVYTCTYLDIFRKLYKHPAEILHLEGCCTRRLCLRRAVKAGSEAAARDSTGAPRRCVAWSTGLCRLVRLQGRLGMTFRVLFLQLLDPRCRKGASVGLRSKIRQTTFLHIGSVKQLFRQSSNRLSFDIIHANLIFGFGTLPKWTNKTIA